MRCEVKYAVWDGESLIPCEVNGTTGEPLKSMRVCARRPTCPIKEKNGGLVCVALEPPVHMEVSDEDR